MKISENDLVNRLRDFLISEVLVDEVNSYFSGDNDSRADVELDLTSDRWQGLAFKKIYIEAKTHHSKDSQNTINKIFGQLLKETGKRTINSATECLAILFPSENAQWLDNKNKPVTKISGVDYYRRGFSRINSQVFIDFGELVGAKYVFSYTSNPQILDVFEWESFLDCNSVPILSLTNQ